ncbi:MAG: hypothetical protein AB7K09_23010, partial [Planctomycetota bacterium]
DKEWGNWPSTASFLIFVHTLINTLAPSDATQRTLAPGGTLQRRWELEKYGPTVTMTSPDGSTRSMHATIEDTGFASIEWTDTSAAGVYLLELAAVGKPEPEVEVAVVNGSVRESDLRPVAVADLVAGRAGWRVSSNKGALDLLGGGDASTLAVWLLAIVGLLLVGDVILGTRAARRRQIGV